MGNRTTTRPASTTRAGTQPDFPSTHVGEQTTNPAPGSSLPPPTYTEQDIPLTDIIVGPQLIRASPDDDDIVELAAEIARRGLLQPIGVHRIHPQGFQLLWGYRRCCAHHRLGRTTITAHVYDDPPENIRALAVVENIHRKQLSLNEECAAVAHLHDADKLSPDQIASAIGKTRSWVLRRLMVKELPIDLREPLMEGDIALGTAEALATISDLGMRAYALNQVKTMKLSTPAARDLVDQLTTTPAVQDAINAGIATATAHAASPPVTYLGCDSCQTPTPLAELKILRVCGACLDSTPQAHTNTHAKPNGVTDA